MTPTGKPRLFFFSLSFKKDKCFIFRYGRVVGVVLPSPQKTRVTSCFSWCLSLVYTSPWLSQPKTPLIKKGGPNKIQPGCNSRDQPRVFWLLDFLWVCDQCHIQAGNSCFDPGFLSSRPPFRQGGFAGYQKILFKQWWEDGTL